jgi:LuxR family maltose regulon positive regulatory protein
MKADLLATKLHRPPVPPKRVQRPHLIQRLNEGLEFDRQITLVSAPAGFGKTTCISEWVNTLDCPVTWLSLDPADDDPGRFFIYLVAALQKVDPNLGQEIAGVLRSGRLSPGEIISTALVNDVLELEGRFLLVLDDFQVIQDRFILQVMQRLVTNLPQPLHLVLLTREDPPLPLARLRANNQLTEIRAGDLRFTGRDAERFLNEVMDLSLSPVDVAVLDDKTEGWIAGLQLAAIALRSSKAPRSSRTPQSSLSVRGRAGPSSFIATLSGSHRFILSYLTEQVLSRQPEEIQDFLLQTAILDRLNGDLCNAVTERSDGHALLERLLNANLFLIPLDDEGQWYRYHHLFADLIRDLQNVRYKDKTAQLHQRASRWYAQAGMSGEAIQHALDAEDYAMAVDLIESHAMDMLMQWHKKTVTGWMQALPPEWAMQSPKTNLAFAWMHVLIGDYSRVSPYLVRLQEMFSGSQMKSDGPLKAEWLALQAMLLNAQGKPADGLALAKQALETVPEQHSHVQSLIYMGLAGAYQQMDNYAHAMEAFQMIVQHGRAAGNFVSEILGLSGLALMALDRGQLHLAFKIAFQGVERIERSGSLPPISATVYGELGQVHYHWHQLEQAHSHFLRAVQVSALTGYSDAEIYYKVILSRLHLVEGDLEAAFQEIQKAVDLTQADAPVAVREEVTAQQVRVYLAQNRLAAAETVLKERGFIFRSQLSIPDLAPGQNITRPVGLLYSSGLRILLHRAQARGELASLREGIRLADHLIGGALQRQYIPVALEMLLLRAQMYAALGNSQARLATDLAANGQLRSQADYASALELAEPEGFITIFVEEGLPVAEALTILLEQDQLGTVQPVYVKTILAAFPSPQPSTEKESAILIKPEALIEPLTDRELDVLRLMAKGLKYQGIADKLFISVNTVRTHVKAIYGKLNVNNRTKAIEMARRLQIL